MKLLPSGSLGRRRTDGLDKLPEGLAPPPLLCSAKELLATLASLLQAFLTARFSIRFLLLLSTNLVPASLLLCTPRFLPSVLVNHEQHLAW